jgi:serine acetyltransferase
MLRYPRMSGVFLPFKIYIPALLDIHPDAKVSFTSRVYIGSPATDLPITSRVPANIFFGEKSDVALGSDITIGPGVNLIVKKNAKFTIGDGTYFTSDAHIEVLNNISIGKGCAISWGVTVLDDNHHQLDYTGRRADKKDFVRIGDRVWIGCNVTVLPGSEIGAGCVIAAGSVVKGTFPDGSLIGGNPAKVLQTNVSWK